MHMMWFGCIMVLSGSFNSFIPYPYHTPGGTKKIFFIAQCMIHYWAVIYYTWLYICTGVWGIDSGSLLFTFRVYSFFLGRASGVLKWECFCLVITVFSRGMSMI